MSVQEKVYDDEVVINGVTLDVDERDDSGYIVEAHGATTPTATLAGFATGAEFTNTTTDKVFINEGSETSCDFQEVVAGEIDASDLGTDSVDSDEIATDAVDSDEIATDAVTKDEIATDAVESDEIAAGAVKEDELDADAVTSAKIKDGEIKSSDLHNDARNKTEVTEVSQLPAPNGSDQLNNDLFVMAAPMNARIKGGTVISDTPTASSDADSHYEFEIYNETQAQSLSSAVSKTDDAELAAETPYQVPVDQNQDIQGGDVIKLRVHIKDDGSPNPTDLSSANLKVQLNWELRD